MVIGPADIGDLSTFALRWRWTDESYALLSPDELSQIKPLRQERAKDIWRLTLESVAQDRDFDVDQRLFEPAERILSRSHEVSAWLTRRLPEGRIPILISWGPDWCVLTDSELFIARWREFCYPVADDASVLPLDNSWVLHYWHKEEFLYAKRKVTG
ncbi:MAG: hypothetical protein ACKVX7_06330 [Planctomycetota bacterium]